MPRLSSIPALVLAGLLGAAAGTAAQQPAEPVEPGIWIADASGQLQRVEPARQSFLRDEDRWPGSVEVVLAVETFSRTATGALSAAELAVRRVGSAISRTGVASSGTTSELAYLEPRLQERILAGSWEKPRQLGYDAAYVVTVRVDRTAVGRVVDAAVGAGATRVLELGRGTTP